MPATQDARAPIEAPSALGRVALSLLHTAHRIGVVLTLDLATTVALRGQPRMVWRIGLAGGLRVLARVLLIDHASPLIGQHRGSRSVAASQHTATSPLSKWVGPSLRGRE